MQFKALEDSPAQYRQHVWGRIICPRDHVRPGALQQVPVQLAGCRRKYTLFHSPARSQLKYALYDLGETSWFEVPVPSSWRGNTCPRTRSRKWKSSSQFRCFQILLLPLFRPLWKRAKFATTPPSGRHASKLSSHSEEMPSDWMSLGSVW
jgi:hypothetical protein